MSIMGETIAIRLHGQETDDGRTYVTSPDLRGFHFVLEPDEEPLKAMEPTLRVFIERYLETKIQAMHPVMTPRDYRAWKRDIHMPSHGVPRALIAAVA